MQFGIGFIIPTFHSSLPSVVTKRKETLLIDRSEPSSWLEIAVEIHPVAHEALSAFFFDLGCHGVVTQSFHDRVFRAYLPGSMDSEKLRAGIFHFLERISKIFPDAGSPKASFGLIESQDWNRLWQKHYRPLRVSEKLTVFPAWDPPPSAFKGIAIMIDPGPAFGTGGHTTTRMCLKAVEECKVRLPWKMLDVGTGSGILAVYGAKLGAERVLAIDNDPEALRWAGRNIALNKVSNSVQLSSLSLKDIGEQFTVVAANLILHTILELLPFFSRTVEPKGWLILSGLLREQSVEVNNALGRVGFRGTGVLEEQEWACITARRME